MLLAQSKNLIQAAYSTIQLLKDITRPPELPASFKKRSLSDSELRRRRSGPGTVLSRKEVALHNTEDDCWLIVRDKVYDVSGWTEHHPGGRVITTYAGKDATDVFSTFHGSRAWSALRPFFLGELMGETVPVSDVVQDFRALRLELLQKGLFQSSKTYYYWKLLSTVAILVVSMTLLLAAGKSSVTTLAAAFFLALFWQQCGWLSHDFLHNQVFLDRHWNTAIGYILGSVFQGFSVDWWKSKHNTHHAAPNELTHGTREAVDPDIDTLPLIAWSAEMLDGVPEGAMRHMVRSQLYYFFPILMVARLSWAQQSLQHAWDLAKVKRKGQIELACLALHYMWTFGLAFAALPPRQALAFLLLAQIFCGLLLGIVFVQSHNGMEVYAGSKDFFTSQIVSTRDIFGSPWNDWFTGGLNYQIEHHLFPTMPRHNLRKAKDSVVRLCHKHGLTYESCSMTMGTYKVLQCLADVAAQA